MYAQRLGRGLLARKLVDELLELFAGKFGAVIVVTLGVPVLHRVERIRSGYAVSHENPCLPLMRGRIVADLMTLSTSGRRLKRWRESMGYSQEALADLLETDQASISRWERGVGAPGIRVAIKLAKLTGGVLPVDGWVAGVKRTA
jgi:DNA-binding XRE family transcriptional regulator